MTDNERLLLEAVKMAYRKHHCSDESVGWEELSDTLYYALVNVMGDADFINWLRELEK